MNKKILKTTICFFALAILTACSNNEPMISIDENKTSCENYQTETQLTEVAKTTTDSQPEELVPVTSEERSKENTAAQNVNMTETQPVEAVETATASQTETTAPVLSADSTNNMIIPTSYEYCLSNDASSLVLAVCDSYDAVTIDNSFGRIEVFYTFTLEKLISGEEVPETFTFDFFADEYWDYDLDPNAVMKYFEENPFFVEGKKYIFPLRIFTSVFKETDEYISNGITYMELDDHGNIISNKYCDKELDESYKTVDEFIQYLEDNDIACKRGVIGAKKALSNELSEIVADTEYVVTAFVESVMIDELDDRTTYICRLTGDFKGEWKGTETFLATLPKGTVEQGNEYLMLLNRVGSETASSYTVSSLKNGIFPKDSHEAKEIISITE